MALREAIAADRDPRRPRALTWDVYAASVEDRWRAILADANGERAVDTFLQENPSLLPVGSVAGYHGVWLDAVFSQPPLRGLETRVPDFLWIERNSAEVLVTCAEIEHPEKLWFNATGTPTADLTQAIDQLAEWRAWFEREPNENFFDTYRLPRDWLRQRRFVQHFVLIYGRNSEFSSDGRTRHKGKAPSLNKKRAAMQRADEVYMTYDRLRPSASLHNLVTVRVEKSALNVVSVPPTFETGEHSIRLAQQTVGLEDSILRLSASLPAERVSYLIGRVRFWRSCPETGQTYIPGSE